MHILICHEVATALIAGFSSRKRKSASLVYVGPVAPEQMSNHDCVHMGNQMVKDAGGTLCNTDSERCLDMVAMHVTCIFTG